jgi:Flp pilus assembly protein TadD
MNRMVREESKEGAAEGGASSATPLRPTLEEALRHQSAGRLDAAEALYRTVLRREPENADALHLLGMVAGARGNPNEALELIRRAIAAKPRVAQFYNSLGTVLGGMGRSAEAERAFREAIACNPGYGEAYRNMGLALQRQGRSEEAVSVFRSALKSSPGRVDALESLGAALRASGRIAEAVDVELELLGRRGGTARAFLAVGLSLRELRRLDEAVETLRRAAALAPDDAEIHFNLALVLLEAGRYEEGFVEYEWRWRMPDFESRRPQLARPLWDGSALRGRTILLHTEQGLGTNIQFVRYAAMAAQRGGDVIVGCPPSLAALFRTTRGVSRVIAAGQPLPPFDVHLPLASLPRVLGTTLATIPVDVPYLSADAARLAAWRERIGRHGRSANVGLVWAGNSKPDPKRTCPLEEFERLTHVDGARCFSLQKGSRCNGEAWSARPIDLSADLTDFAETAAAVAALDLVISVDTSVAHLAGALAKPVWTLLPYLSDWRWLVGREDSAWYPTMRLFRQHRPGDWRSVLDRVALELEAAARSRSPKFEAC